ncbi:acetate--CoA ligase [Yonghaparkia sp. Root332]|uniref:acetate--CoA ligase n=1 Tax=Yonghaparkia sp. Root332 TaxID=1736516 RepID=UPI0006F9BF41|nr:acetate--CoA ligase [Yonghaparkia sp. Root332]KQV26044.1 acetyl-coenzyme A synthetase [Yonghaparkia sp. Root332]
MSSREAPAPVPSTTVHDSRRFPPSAEFVAQANVTPADLAALPVDPLAFWEQQAHRLPWARPWDSVHHWVPPSDDDPASPRATWFAGGALNASVVCVDSHVDAGRGETVALHFEGERGDRESVTYGELQRRVAQAAHALEALGVEAGDRVVIYLPVLVETVVAALAVARLGAVHSLVFGGFSAEALRFRVADTGAKVVIASDGQFRRGSAVGVKAIVDEAVAGLDHVEHVLVVRRTGDETPGTPWVDGRDVWWHEAVDDQPEEHVAPELDAEHPLFITYTSGTTGRPKGVVHTTGGYLVQASWSHWAAFDAKPDDVYWCTADLAWVTAHTYVLYGPLSNGASIVIAEGSPDHPAPTRHAEIIERLGVTVYYTAPTLIRTFMARFPDGFPSTFDLSTVRLLGTVGEAINPEAWVWFHVALGGGRAPIVDTWWQSESGAAIVSTLPGVHEGVPGAAGVALPGLAVRVVDEQGADVAPGSSGYITIEGRWPAMARTVWGDHDRYRSAYWSRFSAQGLFFAGDGATIDERGYVRLQGRVDDVINVSGHRLSTIEIESALVAHPLVAEAGVVGVADAVTGQAVAAFVVPVVRPGSDAADAGAGSAGAGGAEGPALDAAAWRAAAADARAELAAHIARVIGPVAKPKHVLLVPDLPKTRSGKIMRRLLGDVLDGRELGDTTSLQDESVVPVIAAIARG